MIAGRYEIEEVIGAGGMGVVYQGLDTQTAQKVAIKQLNFGVIKQDPTILERFAREGAALRELNHPNIVRMLDMVTEGQQPYLVMEFVSGGDLRSLIHDKPLPIKQILRWGIDLADALTRAHKLHIIHRDLKPANVLIAEDGTLKLADFGVAFFGQDDAITTDGQALGTMGYMAPEVMRGETIDTRSDIWSFGIMLFEMLAGHRPFKGDVLAALITAVLSDKVPDLESLRPETPVGLIDLIYRMLIKNHEERISSVRHVGAALEDVLQGRETDTYTAIPNANFGQSDPEIIIRPKHNLPTPTTPLVGREAELETLANFLRQAETRLVTIAAPGGMGKTRLALEAARQQITIFTGGVYMIELAPLSDENGIITALAEALGYQFQQEARTFKAQLLDYLRPKNLLLVMDNCEHLLEICAAFIGEILLTAPEVKILATTRQRINHTGEVIFTLQGLDLSEWTTLEEAAKTAAVQLFMQNAQRIRPSFALTDETLPHVGEICRLVYGMPLGIVLAANWLPMLSVEEIVTEIQQNIDFLETSMSDIPQRQRSIRAVFDYSWDLMNADERQAFMKLSVFKGGFTRPAAQAVAQASLSILMSLLNKSLIQRNADTGRFNLHEMLRQYGLEQLKTIGQDTSTFEAHLKFFANFVQEQELAIKNKQDYKGLDTLRGDFENIRAAWKYAVEIRNFEALNQMLEGVKLFVEIKNRYQEREQFFVTYRQALFPSPAPQEKLWRRMLVRYAGFLGHREDVRAEFEQCLEAARASNDAAESAYCLFALGDARSSQRDVGGAFAAYTEALEAYKALNDYFYACKVANRLATASMFTGQLEACKQYVTSAMEFGDLSGNHYDTGWARHSMGSAQAYLGDWDQCQEHFEIAAQIWIQFGSQEGLATAYGILSWVYLMHKGDRDKTEELIAACYALAEESQNPIRLAYGYIGMSLLKLLHKDYPTAFRYAQDCIQFTQRAPFLQTGFWPLYGLCAYAEERYDLVQDSIVQGLRLGQMIKAWGYVLPLFVVAALLKFHEHAFSESAELWGFYLHHPMALHGFLKQIEIVKTLPIKLEAVLGTEAYQAALVRGEALVLEQITDQLLAKYTATAAV